MVVHVPELSAWINHGVCVVWSVYWRAFAMFVRTFAVCFLLDDVDDAVFWWVCTWWVELQTRYGNQFYVRDNGEDGSLLATIGAVELCLDRGGCQFVPGLPQEQWLLTLATSVLGGLIAGFAAYPRKEGERFAWAWVLLLSPLWVMLFGVFGIAPVVTRTSDVLPLVRNGMGFVGGMVGAYLIAQTIVGRKLAKETDE